MEKFVIIDGNNIMCRSYYALPRLANFEGQISNGVFGFCNILVKIIRDVKPKYIAVAFDSAKKNFRHSIYEQYKGQRRPTPQELIDQFPMLKEILGYMNITAVEQHGLEADDLIGCLSRKYDVENIIITADKDCLQLINKNTFIMQPQKGITETELVDEKVLKEKMGICPRQIIDFKGLAGDPSDNIPGVMGVGEKTAIDLLQKYDTVEGVYENIDKTTGKLREKLETSKDDAFMSKKLATIVTDAELPYQLSDFEYSFPFNAEVLRLFKKYQFNSLLKHPELFTENMVQEEKIEVIKIDDELKLKDLVNKLSKSKEFAFTLDEKALNVSIGKEEYKISFAQNLLDVGLDYLKVLNVFKSILENSKIEKIVFDYKKLKHTLHDNGIELNGVTFDCLIARYLINANGNNSVNYLDVVNENLLNVENSASNLYILKERYLKKMEELDTKRVFYDIEMPLVDILYNMEIQGVEIDKTELSSLEAKYETKINELTAEIYELAGKKFNINSPKQLGEVLFDDLKIKSYNNKKKSTNAQVLSDIVGAHPIVQKIIDYRFVSKIYTTYLLAYKDIVKNGKIYTVFNQTLTSTGRLSSSEPNLQNIPVRSEEGKLLRKMFISSFKGGKIVDADYNQIELRLLASFSGDEKLINAYANGVDIHALTASEVFGIPLEMVTPEIRRNAKAINFGIVYGMSDFGLSQNIGVTRNEAAAYIKKYFERYPKIKEYMDSNIEFCKQHGYVKTMFGRVRYIPEINDSNYNMRMFGERAAMNMPLQGSASDIIKLAMIGVFRELEKQNLKSKLVLQVHDELVIDTHPDEVEAVKNILKTVMENVVKLKVKLLTSVEVGDTWYDAH